MIDKLCEGRRLCRYRRPTLASRLQRGAEIARSKPEPGSFEELGVRAADALDDLRKMVETE